MSLLELDGLTKFFRDRRRSVTAVSDVSLSVEEGETVGLIGESGSGKSTLARLAAVLMRPDRGRVMLDGVDLLGLGKPALRARRAQFQMVFQEPLQSLNPRMTVESIVAEPLSVHRVAETKATHRELVHRVLEQVGLPAAAARRRPGQLSGGQQQRVGIARAVVLRPRLLILDEPTSSLDVSIRANILNLLGELQRDLGLAYLFISHDLSTVRYFCSRTVVLRRGVIVESGPTDQVLEHPSHDYTTELLRASLSPTPPSAD